jgi:putative flippase GtrA
VKPPRPALRSGLWFVAVGVAAALTHFAVFTLARHAARAEWANAAGFAVAFWVSFFGHRRLSFGDAGTAAGHSLRRFAVIALAGLVSNAVFFIACHRGLRGTPSVAWLVAAVLTAGQTFVLSRFWAFRR